MKASTSRAKDEPPSARAFAADGRAKKNSMRHINVIENHKSLMTHSEVGKLNEMASHRWRAENFQLLKNVHEWTALTFVVCRMTEARWKFQSEAMKIFSDPPVVRFFFALAQSLFMTNCSKLEIVWWHSKFRKFLHSHLRVGWRFTFLMYDWNSIEHHTREICLSLDVEKLNSIQFSDNLCALSMTTSLHDRHSRAVEKIEFP